MSFILDALKKLDHKQKPGSVPDLLTVHEPAHREPRKRPWLLYVILLALILNAGIIALWLHPWESEKTVVVTQPPVDKESISSAQLTEKEVASVTPKAPAPAQAQLQDAPQEIKTAPDAPLAKPVTTVQEQSAHVEDEKPLALPEHTEEMQTGAPIEPLPPDQPALPEHTADIQKTLPIESQPPIITSPPEQLPRNAAVNERERGNNRAAPNSSGKPA
jgi:hypothetical protein